MKYLRYLISLPNDIVFMPLVLLIHLLWGTNLRMEGLSVCTDLKAKSWPANKGHWLPFSGWYSRFGGTTFGHAIMYRPDPDENTIIHEHTHEHQMESVMLKSLIVGLIVLLVTGKLWLSYAIWSMGYMLYLCTNWAMSAIRGGHWYVDSVHEEHAYAIGESLWNEERLEEYRAKYNKIQ